LAGVTRSVTLEICRALNVAATEVQPRTANLLGADGLFLSLSTLGIVEASELDGHRLRCSPLVDQIRMSYARLLVEETA
jgi:branched-subunit amino acid aminotransferase/4-amino-4-deoxychorismate lyase